MHRTISAKIGCGLARIRPLSHSFFITGNFGEEIIFFYDPHVVGILSYSFHHEIGCCLLEPVYISSVLAFVCYCSCLLFYCSGFVIVIVIVLAFVNVIVIVLAFVIQPAR